VIDLLSGPDESSCQRVTKVLESAGYAGPTVLAHYEARAGGLPRAGRRLLEGIIASIRKKSDDDDEPFV